MYALKKISITGIAGFIGFHAYQKLREKYDVNGIDSLQSEITGCKNRSKLIPDFRQDSCANFLDSEVITPDLVLHLAASTGIKNSTFEPNIYLENNVFQTFELLEKCRKRGIKYMIYASSSSVYEPVEGSMNENAATENQLSFYGTTKKMEEIMIENYCRQFGMIAIGLRFFTVYGSFIREDMAGFLFMESIFKGIPITLYNYGEVHRDFTHVSDIVAAIELLIIKIQDEKPGSHQLFNIGFGSPVSILNFADLIAKNMKRPLIFESYDLPKNELESTHCDHSKLRKYIGFSPKTNVEKGVAEMVNWYLKQKNV
jgi:UDP-glucuronate 4-epimerase